MHSAREAASALRSPFRSTSPGPKTRRRPSRSRTTSGGRACSAQRSRGPSSCSRSSSEAAAHVRPHDVTGAVLVSADLGQHAKWLLELADLGVAVIYLHHVGKEQGTASSSSACCPPRRRSRSSRRCR